MKIFNNAIRGGAGWRVRLDDVHDVSDCLSPCPVTFLQPGQRFLWSGYLLQVDDNASRLDGYTAGMAVSVHQDTGVRISALHIDHPDAETLGPVALCFSDPTAQVLAAPYTGSNLTP